MARDRAPGPQSRPRAPWAALSRLRAHPRAKTWFARVRAILWVVVGVASFPLGWASSVVLVWIASVYANVESSVASSEAADDTAVTDRLDRLEAGQERIIHLLSGQDAPGEACPPADHAAILGRPGSP